MTWPSHRLSVHQHALPLSGAVDLLAVVTVVGAARPLNPPRGAGVES